VKPVWDGKRGGGDSCKQEPSLFGGGRGTVVIRRDLVGRHNASKVPNSSEQGVLI